MQTNPDRIWTRLAGFIFVTDKSHLIIKATLDTVNVVRTKQVI